MVKMYVFILPFSENLKGEVQKKTGPWIFLKQLLYEEMCMIYRYGPSMYNLYTFSRENQIFRGFPR